MNTHPYLRAYMAGVVVPSLFLLVALSAFIVTRIVLRVDIPIERVIIFPMAVVPNLFGVWNMVYVALRTRRHLPIGLHGALLPLVIAPLGVIGALVGGFLHLGGTGVTWFGAVHVPYALIVPFFFAVLCVYYLVWKYFVGFFNQELGIA